ncbi:MAG: S1C family serine protease [Lachnospiraceae bacterium]|jgi:serine protease Do|nr:S1C family serine protease [Lachnospiraceae bacterium]
MKKNEDVNQEDSDFLLEKIKQRPLNRKKLLRRTLITALMAVLFGTIACVTFLLLEPVINNRLYPQEEPPLIDLTEEIMVDEREEIGPEDMIVNEEQMQAENTEPATALMDEEFLQAMINATMSMQTADTEDFVSMVNAMMTIARDAERAMVTVTAVNSDVDIFNNAFESRAQTSGVIVGDNGINYMVLTKPEAIEGIESAEAIMVTFIDGKQHQSELLLQNDATGFAILVVSQETMTTETKQAIKVIELGSSASVSMTGSPIIALGDVFGSMGSICPGFVTSTNGRIDLEDAFYKQITTNISGSSNATGILINMQGQAIGIIDNSYNNNEIRNIVSAVGISELRQLIQSLSNNIEKSYAGIYGMDVTPEVNELQGVPLGVYVTEISMDSPAMAAGIQSGDVIIKSANKDIRTYRDFINTLFTLSPEEEVLLTVMRQGPEGYREVELTITMGHSSQGN